MHFLYYLFETIERAVSRRSLYCVVKIAKSGHQQTVFPTDKGNHKCT